MAIMSEESKFTFEGAIPVSKSSYNRAKIIQSFEPKIKVVGEGLCDDIVKMREAINHLSHNELSFDCGEAGTVLRFLAMRVSREAGEFLLIGKPRLFKRPQTELAKIFSQLGINYQMQERGMKIISQGWKLPNKPLKISGSESSQFLSGMLLNCWNLSEDISIELPAEMVSEDYFRLTLDTLKEFGMQWLIEDGLIKVFKNQKPNAITYLVESDVSSTFAVAALAAVSGQALIKQFPFGSKQPDIVFLDVLKRMGVHFEKKEDALWVEQAEQLKAIDLNILNCPDLFPVLSALAATAEGETKLFGAPHLKFKESNRIEEVVTLLRRLGVDAEEQEDGALIRGSKYRNTNELFLDTKDDHRLVMMATVLKAVGFKIKIQNPEIVGKSFPEFLEIAKGIL
ncbi:MAG: hypothetical protein RJB66_2514 [Pseudomonadota bacterium]|jgi:3-phosphoshikimate 1-carboxyvinyltransferase